MTMMMNRSHACIVGVWFLCVLLSYIFFIPPLRPSHTSHHEALERASPLVDAVVVVAMATMAEDPMVDFALASVRKVGNWRGPLYVLTDRPGCFADAVKTYDATPIEVQKLPSLAHIKALKPALFRHLPASVRGPLYLDVDVVVTRDLRDFFADVKDAAARHLRLVKGSSSVSSGGGGVVGTVPGGVADNATLSSGGGVAAAAADASLFDFGAFLDAKGHYVGFCSGCDKWHTGVVWLQRPTAAAAVAVAAGSRHRRLLENGTRAAPSASVPVPVPVPGAGGGGPSNACMESWEKILLSGKFSTDQESLDEAERTGACAPDRALVLPARHLLFAKDYIGMALTSGQTFLHLTAAGRLDSQDFFYRDVVVPRLRNALKPAINPAAILRKKKTC